MARLGRYATGSAVIVVALLVGAGGMVGVDAVNHYTEREAFCTSCHSMSHVVADAAFQQSVHRSNPHGIQVTCSDCHISAEAIIPRAWEHATTGLKDIISEMTHDFSDASAWEDRRVELAHYVREEMRENDSVTCRKCHDGSKVTPESEGGRAAHALLAKQDLTCIDCHMNLVHAPVAPDIEFIRKSGLGTAREAAK